MSAANVKAAIEDAEVFEVEPETFEEITLRLAGLSTPEYDRNRRIEANRLGIRVGTLDDVVGRARRQHHDGDRGPSHFLADPEPWPQPVDAGELLDKLVAVLKTHLVLPQGAAEAVALWTIFAHAHDCFDISPILAVTSPTPACGKTTLMTMLGALVPRALAASNVTTASIFRAVDKWRPTLLIDEADTFLASNDEIRGVINSGHQRASAYVLRTVGDDHEPRQFGTWAPKAIALIGKLPATLASRSIHIELRRKTEGDTVKSLRSDRLGFLKPFKSQAARWAADNLDRLRSSDPAMPVALYDRDADNWRGLIAIADQVGSDWPALARRTAEALGGRRREEVAGVMLLQDVRHIFAERRAEKLLSIDLETNLGSMEDRPWPEWRHGKPITKSGIAKLLSPFGIKPRSVRISKQNAKGYVRADFDDAFGRYLEREAVTPSQAADSAHSERNKSRHKEANVRDGGAPGTPEAAKCDAVTAKTTRSWEETI